MNTPKPTSQGTMMRVRKITVYTERGSYRHDWSFTAMQQPMEAIDEMANVYSSWKEMDVTIWRVKT